MDSLAVPANICADGEGVLKGIERVIDVGQGTYNTIKSGANAVNYFFRRLKKKIYGILNGTSPSLL